MNYERQTNIMHVPYSENVNIGPLGLEKSLKVPNG